MPEEFAVIRDGIIYPVQTYAECLRTVIDDPAARMVRRDVSDWRWTC